ncbi:hypothetical protein EPO44_12335 [bacterium]|nr:MAG: hypothetical protein EPO44_12335 [bacterium]
MGHARFFSPKLIFLLLLFSGGVVAQEGKEESPARQFQPKQGVSGEASPAKLSADVIKTMTAYQASLESLLKIYDEEFKKKVAQVQERREFYEKGYISRLELDQSQRELAGAEAKVRDTEQKIAEAKIGIAEATALEQLLKLPPLTAGGYIEKGALIRYNGKVHWSLADAGKIQKFFSERFGHLLPISALGQTPFHERMKFDHRDAMDVALHPDSSEGRELMAYLRKSGIPFVAFRNGVPGSATGAHIHVGKPSLRAAAR